MNKIEKETLSDFKTLNQSLESACLPVTDINDQTDHFFNVIDDSGNLAGGIGLERYSNY